MGFPLGYTEFMIPKFLLHVIFFFGHIRRFITWFFNVIGLGDLLLDTSFSFSSSSSDLSYTPNDTSQTTLPWTADSHRYRPKKPLYASLIQEAIPVVKYEGGGEGEGEKQEDSCAVCLHEFTSGDEVRQLTNCRHVFHKCCLDPWVELDQRTCPLCRTSLVPEDIDRKLQGLAAGGGGGGETNLGLLSSPYFYYDDYHNDDAFGFMMPSQTEPYSWASTTPTAPLYL